MEPPWPASCNGCSFKKIKEMKAIEYFYVGMIE